MNDEPTGTHPAIEALRDRRRQIELDLATNTARLEEVNDMLAMLQGPRRGRPRRPPPPQSLSDAIVDPEAMQALEELLDPPGTTPTGAP
jgi:hypothetical protein